MIVYFAFLLSDLYGTVLTPPLPVWWFLWKGFNFRQNLAQRSLSIRGLYWQGLFLAELTTALPLHQRFVLTGLISDRTYHSVTSPSEVCTDRAYFWQNLPQHSLSIRGLYWQGLFPIKLTTVLPLHQGFVLMGFISYQTYHSVPSPSGVCTDGVYSLVSNLPPGGESLNYIPTVPIFLPLQ